MALPPFSPGAEVFSMFFVFIEFLGIQLALLLLKLQFLKESKNFNRVKLEYLNQRTFKIFLLTTTAIQISFFVRAETPQQITDDVIGAFAIVQLLLHTTFIIKHLVKEDLEDNSNTIKPTSFYDFSSSSKSMIVLWKVEVIMPIAIWCVSLHRMSQYMISSVYYNTYSYNNYDGY